MSDTELVKRLHGLINRRHDFTAYEYENMIRDVSREGAARIEALAARVAKLEGVLKSIPWKSADKDNREYSACITVWLMDEINAALATHSGDGEGEE